MNVLIFSTSTNNVNTFIGSLESLGTHSVNVFFYDRKWHETAHQLIATDQSNLERIQSGHLRIRRGDCAMDKEMLLEAKISQPDVIVYISAWTGDFVPLNETLGELNQIAPVVHFLCDGGDHPWWPQLQEFERRGTFSLTVNIDGSHIWPGGKHFFRVEPNDTLRINKALTLLTPVDVRHFTAPPWSFGERPYPVGYAGNQSGAFRACIVQRLQGIRGFGFRDRDTHPHSYEAFVKFLRQIRVSVSVPFTGSSQARHVKGRVLETGFAGGCLLEWSNDATREWFTPRAEYWEYTSIEECGELAEWLAAHPRIAAETAAGLQDRVRREHAPEVFWKTVFAGVGK